MKLTARPTKYYTGVPVVVNSLIGVGPFIMASVEMEKYCSDWDSELQRRCNTYSPSPSLAVPVAREGR
jgi:hypothetical protein